MLLSPDTDDQNFPIRFGEIDKACQSRLVKSATQRKSFSEAPGVTYSLDWLERLVWAEVVRRKPLPGRCRKLLLGFQGRRLSLRGVEPQLLEAVQDCPAARQGGGRMTRLAFLLLDAPFHELQIVDLMVRHGRGSSPLQKLACGIKTNGVSHRTICVTTTPDVSR
uniref:Uncharacterized protein n=1 Tax=Schlesneria paludicola TaxID=360056 RepID=A0A7C4LNR3_9PLAN